MINPDDLRRLDTAIANLEDIRYSLAATSEQDTVVRRIAKEFSQLDDDHQAKFFSAIAAIMQAWGEGKADQQLYYIARHMKTCQCATPEGREFVQTLAQYLGEKWQAG